MNDCNHHEDNYFFKKVSKVKKYIEKIKLNISKQL